MRFSLGVGDKRRSDRGTGAGAGGGVGGRIRPDYALCYFVGSILFDGVTFRAYPEDHEPPHVHGRYQDVVVIVELAAGRRVRLADRKDAIRPADAKINQVRHVLSVASAHFDELLEKWEAAHA